MKGTEPAQGAHPWGCQFTCHSCGPSHLSTGLTLSEAGHGVFENEFSLFLNSRDILRSHSPGAEPSASVCKYHRLVHGNFGDIFVKFCFS